MEAPSAQPPPVQMGQPGAPAQPVGGKNRFLCEQKSFARLRKTRKRPPLIAEAMVDPDVAIPGVIEKGKLLTLTTEEALKHQACGFSR